MYKNLIDSINRISPISSILKEKIILNFKNTNYKKNTVLVRNETYATKLYFITKGLVKVSTTRKGKENILLFFSEGEFCTSGISFFSNLKSEEELVCLEDCEMLYIEKSDFFKLCDEMHEFEKFCRCLLFYDFERLIRIRKELEHLEGYSKYESFLNSYHKIANRLSLTNIAKFLGMSNVTISRIRGKYKHTKLLS